MPMLPSDMLINRLPSVDEMPKPVTLTDWLLLDKFIKHIMKLKIKLERLVEVIGPTPPHIIYNEKEGMTIVIFADGEKIISKTTKDDEFNPEVGLAMCLVKRMMSRSSFKRLVRSGHWMDNTDE